MGKTDLPEIKKGEKFAMRPQTPEEKQAWKDAEIPEYKIELNLSAAEEDRLRDEAFKSFEALKNERVESGIEKIWDQKDKQYDGQMNPIPHLELTIDVRESKIKVDTIVRSSCEAFLPDSGDIIDVTPRPDSARKDGYTIAAKQQEFLDWAMDEEIKPGQALQKAFTSAAKKFVGITKLVWAVEMQNRRREEHWEGKMKVVGVRPDGKPIIEAEGLRNFVTMYPDAVNLYPAHVKKLARGENIDIVVNYREQVRNNPELRYVPIEDFYVRNGCDYNRGLASEHCIVERRRYSYWELEQMEKSGEFKNVYKLCESDSSEESEELKSKEHAILEFTTYFKLDPADEEETKIKAWFSEEKKVFLGAIQFPYYGIDCDYIGWWMTTNEKGFYGMSESIMHDVYDVHIAQNMMISNMVHGTYVRNIVTPLVESGSDAESIFRDHQFQTGKPIPIEDEMGRGIMNQIGFLQYPTMDTNGGLAMSERLKRIGSDVTRVTDLITGGESQLDPTAPATKTLALLRQSGAGISDYIRSLKPSFDLFASMLLQLYYQMSTEDRAYQITSKSNAVTGENVFGTMSREEMSMRTTVQSRAASFAFDKANEAQKAMAAYQVVMGSPYLAMQPQVQFESLKALLETFGGKYKAMSDKLLSPEDFAKKQEAVAEQVMMKMMQAFAEKARVTGIQPSMGEIMQAAPQAITAGQAQAFNPAAGAQEMTAQGGM